VKEEIDSDDIPDGFDWSQQQLLDVNNNQIDKLLPHEGLENTNALENDTDYLLDKSCKVVGRRSNHAGQ